MPFTFVYWAAVIYLCERALVYQLFGTQIWNVPIPIIPPPPPDSTLLTFYLWWPRIRRCFQCTFYDHLQLYSNGVQRNSHNKANSCHAFGKVTVKEGRAGWHGRIQGGGVVNPTPNIIKDKSVGRKRNMRGNRRVKEMLRQTLKKCCFYQNNKSTLPLHYFCIRPCYKCWLIMILRFCYITTGWINIPCLYDTGDFMKKVPTATCALRDR